jgi:hypothetical protein
METKREERHIGDSAKGAARNHVRKAQHGGGAGLVMGLALAALAASAFAYTSACSKSDDKAARKPTRSSSVAPSSLRSTALSASADAPKVAEIVDGGADGQAAYEGPFAGAVVMQAPIYSEMSPTKENLIGYMRSGSRTAVDPKPIKGANCKEGWYQLIPRGYICGRHISLDAEDPRVKLGVTPAKLDQVVPYQYAHNTKDGTPLYRTVPSREQMNEYEPYLTSAVRAREREEKRRRDDEDQEDGTDREDRDADAGVGLPSPGENAEADAGAIPWWQRTPDGGKADIKLAELNEGSDSVLARRMVKGFYVAVDRAFGWNNRLWYKTTEGLVAPADRMSINKPPSFHGVDLGGTGQPKLPIGFINGAGAFKFELSADGKSFEKKGRAAFHTIAALTGKTQSRGGVDYWETVEGW